MDPPLSALPTLKARAKSVVSTPVTALLNVTRQVTDEPFVTPDAGVWRLIELTVGATLSFV